MDNLIHNVMDTGLIWCYGFASCRVTNMAVPDSLTNYGAGVKGLGFK